MSPHVRLIELDLHVNDPEFAGKMDFYLNLLNDKERGPDDGCGRANVVIYAAFRHDAWLFPT